MGKTDFDFTNSNWNLHNMLSVVEYLEPKICVDVFRYCDCLWDDI